MSEFTMIKTAEDIVLPAGLFLCPICKAAIVVDEVSEWEEDDEGLMQARTVKINCITDPDIESDEWEDWFRGHWSMPYVDWLPLEETVTQWVNERYRWEL